MLDFDDHKHGKMLYSQQQHNTYTSAHIHKNYNIYYYGNPLAVFIFVHTFHEDKHEDKHESASMLNCTSCNYDIKYWRL